MIQNYLKNQKEQILQWILEKKIQWKKQEWTTLNSMARVPISGEAYMYRTRIL